MHHRTTILTAALALGVGVALGSVISGDERQSVSPGQDPAAEMEA